MRISGSPSVMNLVIQFNRNYKILFRTRLLFSRLFQHLLFLSTPSKWSVTFLSIANPLFYKVNYQNKDLHLVCNNDILLYRAQTFLDKEPETNAWIEAMPIDGVFFDIGANVGVFSMMAASRCKKVYAFEPVFFNYSVLNQNLFKNNLGGKVFAYCLAVGDQTAFNTMRLSSADSGSAHHSFGNNRDVCQNDFQPVFSQGSLSVSLDDLVYRFGFECPTYLKIDVDGNENLIITGAQKVLHDPLLKSILIELNKDLAVDRELVEKIKSAGFRLEATGEEFLVEGHKIGNVIFKR